MYLIARIDDGIPCFNTSVHNSLWEAQMTVNREIEALGHKYITDGMPQVFSNGGNVVLRNDDRGLCVWRIFEVEKMEGKTFAVLSSNNFIIDIRLDGVFPSFEEARGKILDELKEMYGTDFIGTRMEFGSDYAEFQEGRATAFFFQDVYFWEIIEV